jgi:protein-tyrosine phosphatase
MRKSPTLESLGRFPISSMALRNAVDAVNDEGWRQRLQGLMRHNFGSLKGWLRLQLAQWDYVLGSARKFTRPDLSQVERLVFICLANLNRSAFAHAVAERHGLHAASFGLNAVTGQSPHPMSCAIAREVGVVLDHHLSVNQPDFEPAPGDLYLVMELRHAYHLVRQGWPPKQIALLGYWSRPQRLHLQDPHRMGPDYVRSCFTLIESAVRHLGLELKRRGRAQHAPDASRVTA